ncbi:MAG: alpha/beta fold hydrolase [Rhodobacteraceae bacterium]|nr:alpha/beta fold hydrolase [Paracoccaceae bacterium]
MSETMSDTVTRVPPGTVHDIDAHQGWALTRHEPGPARARSVDLLFVHGMAAGAWIWPEHWIAAFTGAGYCCWTLSLPGREGGAVRAGGLEALERVLDHLLYTGDVDGALEMLVRSMPGASLFDGPTLDDYSDTLDKALAQIGRPVAAVCHSLGGAVAQNLMRRGRAPEATVLMCSVPPYGTWRAAAEMAVANPVLWQNLAQFSLFGVEAADPAILRANFFPRGISNRDYAMFVNNLRDESLAASAQALGLPPFAPLPAPRNDILVLGGALDRLVPMMDVMLTGLYYATLPEIVPDAGHMLMHEDAGHGAITRILAWLDARETPVRSAA